MDLLFLRKKKNAAGLKRDKKVVGIAVVLVLTVFIAWVSPVFGSTKHTVKNGESLFAIGRNYNVTISALKKENGLAGDTIYPGQVLRIPGASAVSVSRSSDSNYSQDDLYWLARAVYGEARGESYTGQVAVAAVILNRLDSSQFPNTIRGVIFEPLAFTAVADGQIYQEPDATAYKAARAAMEGWDPSGNAMYYWNPAKATSKWIWSRPIIKRIGNHVFAK